MKAKNWIDYYPEKTKRNVYIKSDKKGGNHEF